VSTGRKRKAEAALVQALACGASPEAAGQKAGLSRRTVFRRLADPAFRAEVDSVRADMLRRTSDIISAAGQSAIKTLVTLQEVAASEAVRLGAARSILEIGCKVRENVALQEQLAALEARLATLLRGPDDSAPDGGPPSRPAATPEPARNGAPAPPD
jgi:hypothetical protein